MAYNTKLYKSTGSAFEEVRVASEWGLIANKPSTYTPTAHNHDDLYLKKTAKITLAENSDKLGGQLPAYYAKATDITTLQTALNVKANDSDVVKLTGTQTISGGKTFSGILKMTNAENFNDVYIKRFLGSGSVGTTYANLSEEIKTGGYHRFWKISFPSGVNFWGKVKISLYGGYSSFNASGKMAKEINLNFNTSSCYGNVGCYTELSGYVENDFRISEAIWNSTSSRWEIWIYSHRLSGNNVPRILVEGWMRGAAYVTAFNGITLNATPAFLQDTTYSNVKGNSAGNTLTKTWADLPTYQHPYGKTIATLDDLVHNHDTLYLRINAKATDSNKLNGQLASYYAKKTDLPTINYSSGTLTITEG